MPGPWDKYQTTDQESPQGPWLKYQPATSKPATSKEEEKSVSGFVGNVGRDVGDIAGGLYQAVRHPIDTVEAIRKLGPAGIAKMYADEYSDPLQHAYERPLSTALDFSTVTGIGGLLGTAAKAGKIVSAGSKLAKAADISSAVSRATDPVLLATKATGKVYKAGKKAILQPAAGGISATYNAPGIAAGAGYESAYGGKLAEKTVGKLGVTGDKEAGKAFIGHLTGKEKPSVIRDKLVEAKNALLKKANQELDADMAPIKANRTVIGVSGVRAAVGAERGKAFFHGKPVPGAAEVWHDLDNVIEDWTLPADASKLMASPTASAESIVGRQAVIDVGGGARTTADDYLQLWKDKFHTAEGLDQLKQNLQKVYEGYKAGPNLDRRKAAIAKGVVDAVKNEIEGAIPGYKAAMAKYSAKRKDITELEKTFNLYNNATADTTLRKWFSTIRETAFTNFRGRMEFAKKLVKESGVKGAEHLFERAAGEASHPHVRPNMFQLTSALGGLGYVTGALSSPVAIALVLAHSPRFMGRAAYTAGKVEGLIFKPIITAERALNKLGVTGRGLTLGTYQAGRAAKAEGNKEQVRSALEQKANKLGFKVHGKVLDRLTGQLLSEDPEIYYKGIKALNNNKRLMELFTKIGEEGEQGGNKPLQ